MQKTISWYMSGLTNQAEAEKLLEVMKIWFKQSFAQADEGAWTIDASVDQGPFGWRASLEARKTGVTQ